MADIFISYSSADRARVQPIAQALEQRGWDVWWDREIPLGRPYNEIIPEELDKARCVLVLWSKQSAQSNWVYEEAAKGRDRKILIPALLEATEIPMGFGLLQAADLSDWQRGAAHAGFDKLTANIQDVLDGKAAPGPDRSQRRARFGSEIPRWLKWMLAVLVFGVAAALWLAQRSAQAPRQPSAQGKVIGAKLAHTLGAHTKGVNKVAYSPDGSLLASAGADGRLILWNSATRNAVATLTAHAESVTSIAFAPNGKLFASGSWLGEVILWDTAKREALMAPIAAHEVSVDDIAFSPDGALMATSSSRDGGNVKVWEVPSGKLRYERNARHGAAYCVAFSPDGATLASGGGKYVVLFNAADGRALGAPIEADTGVVYDIAYSADGKVFATAGTDGVRLWDAATCQAIGAPLEERGDQVNGIAFDARGALLASAGHDHTVTIRDRATRQVVGEPLTGHTDYVDAVAFAPDGKQLASAGHDGKVNLWEFVFEQR
jgi:WD40 repeat protein